MALANLALSSTFFEHIVRTNQTVKVINDIENMTHPLANLVIAAADVATNLANLTVVGVTGNNQILSRMSNGVNSIITNMYDDIYADINIARDKANISYNQSNTTYDVANLAYDAANNFITNSAFIISNVILSNTNTYNIIINVAHQHINSLVSNASIGTMYNATNAAFGHANAAFERANLANGTANTALSNADVAAAIAIAAYTAANTAGSSDTTIAAFSKANTAHEKANSANSLALAAFIKANNSGSNTLVGLVFNHANAAFVQANTAYDQANASVDYTNTAIDYTTSVSNVAIAAFVKANNASMNVFNELSSTDAGYYPALIRVTSGQTNQMNVSSTKLYYKPSTGELTSYSFNSLSDETVKDNIQRIENALDLIDKLNGVNFTWKETGFRSSGVIAQNLINVVPHLVYTDEDKPLTVNYDGLSALFIEAIKELNKEVKSIKRHLGM
jgi:hypothetical protein